MRVGFRSGAIWDEVGESDFLHAFFSTICFRLESNNWGSKYPYLQKKLYHETLEAQDAASALDELKEIQTKFEALKPQDVVWDVEVLTKKPPETFFSKTNASKLSDCFITVGNKNLFSLLTEILEYCVRKGKSVKIQSSNELYQ